MGLKTSKSLAWLQGGYFQGGSQRKLWSAFVGLPGQEFGAGDRLPLSEAEKLKAAPTRKRSWGRIRRPPAIIHRGMVAVVAADPSVVPRGDARKRAAVSLKPR